MTWASRFKLFGGVVFVVVLVAAFTAVFLARQSHVTSTSASIAAEKYNVGTDYSGYVTEQFVKAGDRVDEGDPLFSVKSLSVRDFAHSANRAKNASSYTVADDGTITFTAPADGTVSKVDATLGSFVEGGNLLATVDKTGSLFVVGDYSITPRDYQRIEDGAQVDLTLPDKSTVTGTVKKISVQTLDGVAETEIEVDSAGLTQGSHDGLVTAGTPVTATLQLRQDGTLASMQTAVVAAFAKIGL